MKPRIQVPQIAESLARTAKPSQTRAGTGGHVGNAGQSSVERSFGQQRASRTVTRMDMLKKIQTSFLKQETLGMNQLPERNTIVKRAGDIEFWRSICPQLSISENSLGSHMQPYAVPPCDVLKAKQQVLEEGYFQVGPVVPRQETKLIADAVRTVVDHGFPAPFVLVYDQVWQMLSRLENLLSPILGASYYTTLYVWIYYIRSVNEDRAESKEDSVGRRTVTVQTLSILCEPMVVRNS
jgi:hypothetical protein